ncbi:hypothetical protein [Streptomyces sp. NPDC059371]|uniref:hypothetical protein n=1 Tax=Streptomyces sp. NPDC059371 TaxID=3346812 RepID=UPI0036ADEEC9
MHALRSKGRALAVGALATTCVLSPGPAFADRGTGSSDTSVDTSAKRSGHTLESRITYSGSARGSGGTIQDITVQEIQSVKRWPAGTTLAT